MSIITVTERDATNHHDGDDLWMVLSCGCEFEGYYNYPADEGVPWDPEYNEWRQTKMAGSHVHTQEELTALWSGPWESL